MLSKAIGIADNNFDVVLSITVTAKVEKKTAFLVEVHQAGLFAIHGFAQAQLEGILGSYAPNLLFPYAREVISDLVNKGGFPQLLLQPVNFDALYQQHIAERQRQAQEKQDNPTTSEDTAIH
jgi:preprotein translocase subunit SecB